jgi:hypothetical protein
MGAAVLYMSMSVDDVLPPRIELEIVRVIDTPEPPTSAIGVRR